MLGDVYWKSLDLNFENKKKLENKKFRHLLSPSTQVLRN